MRCRERRLMASVSLWSKCSTVPVDPPCFFVFCLLPLFWFPLPFPFPALRPPTDPLLLLLLLLLLPPLPPPPLAAARPPFVLRVEDMAAAVAEVVWVSVMYELFCVYKWYVQPKPFWRQPRKSLSYKSSTILSDHESHTHTMATLLNLPVTTMHRPVGCRRGLLASRSTPSSDARAVTHAAAAVLRSPPRTRARGMKRAQCKAANSLLLASVFCLLTVAMCGSPVAVPVSPTETPDDYAASESMSPLKRQRTNANAEAEAEDCIIVMLLATLDTMSIPTAALAFF